MANSALPVKRSPQLSFGAARALRDEILTGALAPGSRLSVPNRARRVGVSRAPVHNALTILESEVLVRTSFRAKPDKATAVNCLSGLLFLGEQLDGSGTLAVCSSCMTGLSGAADGGTLPHGFANRMPIVLSAPLPASAYLPSFSDRAD